MKRLTTDTPNGNFETMMNYAYAKDKRVILRYGDGEENIDLCEYIAIKAKERGCNLSSDDVMEGACIECDCPLAILYVVATQAAELRERLKEIEDKNEIKSEEKQMDEINYMNSVFDKAIEKYGAEAQLNVLFEEMAELQNAICKYKRGRATVEQIAEEIADVSNMLVQTIMIFDCQELYEKYLDDKINRLFDNLNKEAGAVNDEKE